MDRTPLEGSIVPFARRWHVIHEIDLIRLVQEHRHRLALCAQAEAIADALPDRPDDSTMDAFLRTLEALVLRGERADGDYLEAMLSSGHSDPLTGTLLDHVRHRHMADAAAARELVAAFGEADAFDAPETLGHMLRSFFTGCRRAVDFEQLTIIALAGHRLTPEARAILADALTDSLLN
ncbi:MULTISPECIES: hypothetical protein [Sphingomonas]|jgi:hypothetical protein|uniref:Hemerythrin-like domain-containing protein n=1 Tax=Sphingomonas zeae TaxID=1646122 RepID=A0A7Y6B2G5_9SPHN|nr:MULTISPECIES: hypothetical protein [Sphingomonas]MBB4048525.1 hypothetical protein [Sphingomonas zeae]MDK8187465.1 hypothetical protein [Sphingomonas zeae]MDK8217199.1 hypothetical protein [Sphingomonas sp. UMB7805-LC452B]NUU46209.1 hypothetical protein [Sphingomonas zeae]